MNTCQTSIKPIYYCSVAVVHILDLTGKHEITTFGSQQTDQGWGVKPTNTDLPNTYRRSTTETIMHPIGQNVLLIHPHFGIDSLHKSMCFLLDALLGLSAIAFEPSLSPKLSTRMPLSSG